jgi:hypothetical protein
MKFELKTHHRNISDEELLDDLKRIAHVLKEDTFSSRDYEKHGGKFRSATMALRFNSWNNALEKAGLKVLMQKNIS